MGCVASGMSGTRAHAALRRSPRHGGGGGRPLTCVQRAHVAHSRSEERGSADDTIVEARGGQLGMAGMADPFVGAQKLPNGEAVRVAGQLGCHDAGGHPCRRRRPRPTTCGTFRESIADDTVRYLH